MRGITKDFPGVRALDGVSFDVRPGEIHALVGENGAGKSTLIKILGGVYPHGNFRGEIVLDGSPVRFSSVRDAETAGIAVIHQELALVRHMTVGENIFLGDEPLRRGLVDRDRIHLEAGEIMDKLGLDVDVRAEVVGLGVAEQQLVEIAKALRKQSRILVLDEPTAALAGHEVEVLFGIMRGLRGEGKSLVYISHRIDEVLGIADRITVLRDGKAVWTRDVSECSRASVVRAMVGREFKEMFPKAPHEPGRVLLEVRNVSVEDPDVPGRTLLQNVSFTVRAGEIVGIAGLMGAGRTELLMTIFGNPPGPWRGEVLVEGKPVAIRGPGDAIRAGLALVPEDRKRFGLVPGAPVAQNLSLAHLREFCTLGVVDRDREYDRCRQVTAELDIRAPSLETEVRTLSGGNQQKVVLGKWLLRPPKVLFLDEPTRGIDIGAKVEIHRLMSELTARGMGVVMVSSELPEILGAADRVIVLCEGRVAGEVSADEATAEKIMHLAI